jgi:pullulanase/glycogen debranching enzyme
MSSSTTTRTPGWATPTRSEVQWSQYTPWGVLPGREAPFAWSDVAGARPPLRDLVIYELCVRDFAGTWHGNIHTLATSTADAADFTPD